MTDLRELGIDQTTRLTLEKAGIDSVEKVGNCPHEKLLRILNGRYCHYQLLIARYNHWHWAKYAPPNLPHDWKPTYDSNP